MKRGKRTDRGGLADRVSLSRVILHSRHVCLTCFLFAFSGQALTIPFRPTGSLSVARRYHTATPLPNGKVLVAGGVGSSYLSSAAMYNPSNGAWTATGSMTAARGYHTATSLQDGRVLVAGGYKAGGTGVSGYPMNVELYDPSNGTWTATGSMITARADHTATPLPDGRVLVAGGHGISGYLSSAEMYDPSNGTWTATGSMVAARGSHTATLLPDGKVFVTGGYNGSSHLSSAELYNPSNGTWTATGSMTAFRQDHTASLLPDGKVIAVGGHGISGYLSSAELYNPSNGTWTATGSMSAARSSHTATPLPDGKVLVAGGGNGISCELYNPSNGTWTATGSMSAARESHAATLLPDGKVLVAGGYNDSSFYLSSAELYGCTVTFDVTGGSVVPSKKTYYSGSDAYGPLPVPLLPGYIFNGWWTQPDGSGTRLTESGLLTTNIDHTAYAEWLPDAFLVNRVSSVTVIGNTNAVKWSEADSGDGGMSIELGGTGLLGDGQMAGVEWSVTGPGTLAFDWKVSSEQGYDWLGFYEAGAATTNRISGTGGSWTHVTLDVGGTPTDSHTFRWEYSKDPVGDSVGEDCGWADAISWTPIYALAVNGGSGGGAYTNGTAVPITADAPAAHYAFDRWIGDTNTVADVFAPGTTVRMPASSIELTASYTPILYALAVANGSGGGSYPYDSAVVIGATPYADKRFYRWTGDVDTVADVASATTTVVTAGHTLSVAATYSVPLTVNGGTGSGWYPEGATASVTANADPLYKEFAVWTGDAEGLLDNVAARTASLTIPTRPSTLTATYRDTIARVAGCYGRTITTSGTSGGVSADAASGSPSGTPAVKLGGAGVVPDNGFAAFETSVSGSGTVTFWWRVSSESASDYLKFLVDGTQIVAISGTKGPWAQVSQRIEGSGVSHNLRWEYAKNGSLTSSNDAGWVDDIFWRGEVPDPVITPDIRTAVVTNNLFAFTFLGERGIPYIIYSNATLNAWGWAPMETVPQEEGETNGVFRFDTIVFPPLGQCSGFYRVGIFPVGMMPIPGGTNAGMDPDFGEYSLTVDPFLMDRYEVTKALWGEVYNWAVTNGYSFDNVGSGKVADWPIYSVNWYDCIKWCNARAQRVGREPVYYTDSGYTHVYKTDQVQEPFVKAAANGYRLPTDVQWHYAARGGAVGRRFPWGDTDTIQHARANYFSQSDIDYDTSLTRGWLPTYNSGSFPYVSPVGKFAPNGYGLYDMAGNVWEWCFDWRPSYVGSQRIFRGGGWTDFAFTCRVADRYGYTPGYAGDVVGFRCVLPIEQ